MLFTGQARSVGVSLPQGMIDWLRDRARLENRPISTIVQRALVREARRLELPDAENVLVDSGVEYAITTD